MSAELSELDEEKKTKHKTQQKAKNEIWLAKNCDFLEGEVPLGCPLFMYKDTTPEQVWSILPA